MKTDGPPAVKMTISIDHGDIRAGRSLPGKRMAALRTGMTPNDMPAGAMVFALPILQVSPIAYLVCVRCVMECSAELPVSELRDALLRANDAHAASFGDEADSPCCRAGASLFSPIWTPASIRPEMPACRRATATPCATPGDVPRATRAARSSSLTSCSARGNGSSSTRRTAAWSCSPTGSSPASPRTTSGPRPSTARPRRMRPSGGPRLTACGPTPAGPVRSGRAEGAPHRRGGRPRGRECAGTGRAPRGGAPPSNRRRREAGRRRAAHRAAKAFERSPLVAVLPEHGQRARQRRIAIEGSRPPVRVKGGPRSARSSARCPHFGTPITSVDAVERDPCRRRFAPPQRLRLRDVLCIIDHNRPRM